MKPKRQNGKLEPLPSFLSWLLLSPAERGELVFKRMVKSLELLRDLDIDLSKLNEAQREGALLVADRIISPRRVGRPREHNDDVELVLSLELLSRRDGMTYPEACKTIAPSEHKKIHQRYKDLMKNKHWKAIREVLRHRRIPIETLEAEGYPKKF